MIQKQPQFHHRRSVRLSGFDYSQEGGYFITIVTHDREPLFGEIVNGEMKLSKLGEIAREEWVVTATIRDNVELGEWVIMPDHLHGILFLFAHNTLGVSRSSHTRTVCVRGAESTVPTQKESFGMPVSGSIPTIIRSYKAVVTKRINALRDTPLKKVWQRGFFDHVLADDRDYDALTEYILSNPERWGLDKD
jgi:putative transposase